MTDATAPAHERIAEISRRLRLAHPDAACALHHTNAFQLLCATILSAQCTDERVNLVTPALFARYPTPEALAGAERAALEEMIRSTGFYHNKAKSLQEASAAICARFGGAVPATMDDLLTLHGVARKTANVVLGVSYGIADGVVVDTHVKRLSQKLGLVEGNTPEKIERELMALLPKVDWIDISHLLIFHGRRVCHARKPLCSQCTLADLCPSAGL
ncbi:MAG: endonuclease III [Chloroflexi bacterium]|nr:MAG: endonuclease III [Chloroflexota bacterium]